MAIIENDDKNLAEEKISSERVFDGVLLHVLKDEVRLPNGHTAPREWIKHPGASSVIPLLPDNQIILVKQFRYPVGQVTLEVPAGNFPKKPATLQKNFGNSRPLQRPSAFPMNLFTCTRQQI